MKKIGEPWTARRHSMKLSPAYRVLPLYARRVLDAIEIEHEKHAGKDNGRLIVPYRTLEEYCCKANNRILAQAIRELEALGFITVIHGHAKGTEHAPNKFSLTYVPGHDGSQPDNWKEIATFEDAHVRLAAAQKKRPQSNWFKAAQDAEVIPASKNPQDGPLATDHGGPRPTDHV
jgi:hypothetical protein